METRKLRDSQKLQLILELLERSVLLPRRTEEVFPPVDSQRVTGQCNPDDADQPGVLSLVLSLEVVKG
jgi:hypothetical protein